MKGCVAALALILIACGPSRMPTAATTASSASTGVFTNGDVRLSYRLDLPERKGPVGAVVFGHGSGEQTKDSCRFLADGFL